MNCGSCGHQLVEGETPSAATEPGVGEVAIEGQWRDLEKATRRLLALRAMGHEQGRLLDLGSPSAFAHVAAAVAFEVTALHAAPHGDLASLLLASELPAGTFRAATLWRDFEREPEPIRLLSTVRELLVPGGVVALSVPFAGDRQELQTARVPGARHLFSRSSLRVALERAGFDVIHLMPADLREARNGMPLRDKVAARVSMAAIDWLAPAHRHGAHLAPEVLWQLADAAEVWAVRS